MPNRDAYIPRLPSANELGFGSYDSFYIVDVSWLYECYRVFAEEAFLSMMESIAGEGDDVDIHRDGTTNFAFDESYFKVQGILSILSCLVYTRSCYHYNAKANHMDLLEPSTM